MTLKELLPPNEIFEPRSFYDGDWALNGVPNNEFNDYLALNSNKKNGINLYMQFLQKSYFKPLEDLCQITNIQFFYPVLFYGNVNGQDKRKVYYSVQIFVTQLLYTLMDRVDSEFSSKINEECGNDDIIKFIKDKIRIDMRKHLDVQKKDYNSKYYQQVYNDYLYHLKLIGKNNYISFENFLIRRIKGESNLLNGLRYYKDFFDKKINLNDLIDCFDYDKFCLAIAKSNLDACLSIEKLEGKVSNIVHYLQQYSLAINELKKYNPNYKCAIKYPTMDDKIYSYTSDDLIRDYNSLLVRHPEFSFTYVDIDKCIEQLKKMGFDDTFINNFDPGTENGRKVLSVLVNANKGVETKADWVFIRRGDNNISVPENYNDFSGERDKSNNLKKEITLDEAISRMLKCRDYLQNSGWLYRVHGIKEFEGYEGFIYPNGHVIFEKFYENIETKEVSLYSATYIMNIYNFIELSKLNKREIINIINSPNNPGVRRVYHTKNINTWISKVNNYIIGSYNDNVIDHVNGLIETGILHKERSKKNGLN